MGRKPRSEGLRCETCGETSVIQIALKLPDGTEVEFRSCHRCESRWWYRDGQSLELDAILELARRSRS